MAIQLKIVEMTVDGCPSTCPECGTGSFTLEARGIIDALTSVWGNCVNSHSWEDLMLTAEDLRAIQAASTGRQRAEDDDTFHTVIGGAVVAGTLHPALTVDDIRRATRDVYWRRIIKPAMRRRKNTVKRAVKQPFKAASKTVKRTAADTVAAAKVAAISAAWDWETAGGDPDPDYKAEPVTPCGAGCTDGYFNIKSRLHDATRVRCSACYGTGEID